MFAVGSQPRSKAMTTRPGGGGGGGGVAVAAVVGAEVEAAAAGSTTTGVGRETAFVDPRRFDAVTATRMRWPTSRAASL